jgi:hypothetical protein
MTRPFDPGFDVRISDWLEADPDLAPPDLMQTVESALPSIPQRRVMHLPWRFPPMSTFAKLAVAAVAVFALGAVGIFALQPRNVPTVGADPSASPSPSPSPSPFPSSSPAAAASVAPPLSQTFTSPTNGISIAYPAGWLTRAATEPWTTAWPDFHQETGDVVYDPILEDHLFFAVSSQPVAGTNAEQWASDTLAAEDCVPSAPVTIDGATGLIGVRCDAAAVALDGRGYLIALYVSGDEAWLGDVYDRAWFEQVLATIDLQPEDAASAAPSP